MKELVFLTMVAMEVGKRQFPVIIATVAKRKIYFIKNMNLFRCKLTLEKLRWLDKYLVINVSMSMINAKI